MFLILRLTFLRQLILLCLSLHVLAPALHPLHLGLQETQEELSVSHARRGSARIRQAARALQGRRPHPSSFRGNGQRRVRAWRQVWVLMGAWVCLAGFSIVATLDKVLMDKIRGNWLYHDPWCLSKWTEELKYDNCITRTLPQLLERKSRCMWREFLHLSSVALRPSVGKI